MLGIMTHSEHAAIDEIEQWIHCCYLECGEGLPSEFCYNTYQSIDKQEQEELSSYEDSLLVHERPPEDINLPEVVQDPLDEAINELLNRFGVIKDDC
jgi:hypothetical protein